MSTESPQGPAAPAAGGRERRLLLFVALALLAAVLVMAAKMEQMSPVDPSERIGRRMELSELIGQEQQRARQLEQQVESLAGRIAEYESAAVAGSDDLAQLQGLVDEVSAPGGLRAVQGEGLVVTLEDSSDAYDGSGDPNDLVIHEQDLRAVLNALWAGGAEAVSINDSRVLATSGIRCVGNTLYLNGRLYAPPFVVQAIGDREDLERALDRDPAVQRFAGRADVFRLGFDVDAADALLVPAFSGLAALESAVPAGRDG